MPLEYITFITHMCPPFLQHELCTDYEGLLKLSFGVKYALRDVNGALLATTEVLLGRGIIIYRDNTPFYATNRPSLQFKHLPVMLFMATDAHSYLGAGGGPLIPHLLQQPRKPFVFSYNNTHLLLPNV